MLTFGVEEEFVLLDRGRLSPGNKAATVRRALFASGFGVRGVGGASGILSVTA